MRKLVEAQADMDRLEGVIGSGEYEDSVLDDYNDALKVGECPTPLPREARPTDRPYAHLRARAFGVLYSF